MRYRDVPFARVLVLSGRLFRLKMRLRLLIASRLGRRDPLTGVLSYRRIDEIRPEANIALLDMIGFSYIDYVHGHKRGDEVLRNVARRLKAGLAPRRIFRVGGDEFVVEFEALDEVAAAHFARLIRELVRGSNISPVCVRSAPWWSADAGKLGPLQARVVINLRPVGDDPRRAYMEANAALGSVAERRLPFVILEP